MQKVQLIVHFSVCDIKLLLPWCKPFDWLSLG